MWYVLRSNINWIISEFMKADNSDTTLVLLDWLPSNVSTKRDVIQKFVSLWYSCVAPRYRWTWESEWVFLDHNPADDIKEIVDTIRNWEFFDLYNHVPFKLPSDKIVIVWVSFWWIVALDTLDVLNDNDQCVLVSPLCDMLTFEHDLGQLRTFVKEWYWRAYNYSLDDWDCMLSGDLFKTDYDLIKGKSNNISIIYDDTDSSITVHDVLNFAKKAGIKHSKKVSWYGHLSYSKWDEDIYSLIFQLIENWNHRRIK